MQGECVITYTCKDTFWWFLKAFCKIVKTGFWPKFYVIISDIRYDILFKVGFYIEYLNWWLGFCYYYELKTAQKEQLHAPKIQMMHTMIEIQQEFHYSYRIEMSRRVLEKTIECNGYLVSVSQKKIWESIWIYIIYIYI